MSEPVARIVTAYPRKVRPEEKILGEVFGPWYEEDRRQSRALVPWVF